MRQRGRTREEGRNRRAQGGGKTDTDEELELSWKGEIITLTEWMGLRSRKQLEHFEGCSEGAIADPG